MVKIKILAAETSASLEDAVNYWLDSNSSYDIVDIQYRVREHAWCNYSVCITYRDDS